MDGDQPSIRDVLGNSSLSYKAKGILLHLMEFGYSFEHPCDNGREGPDSIRSGIKELKDAGIITFAARRASNGAYAFSKVTVTWQISRFDDPPSCDQGIHNDNETQSSDEDFDTFMSEWRNRAKT